MWFPLNAFDELRYRYLGDHLIIYIFLMDLKIGYIHYYQMVIASFLFKGKSQIIFAQ